MTPSVESDRNNASRPHRRFVRLTAVGVTVGVAAAAIVGSTGASAAAATLPQAQSVGNFVDATVGGNTIDQLARIKYATAKAPGSTSVQNPLDVTALNAINVPLTGSLQLPTVAGIHLGAVTQKAQANVDGAAYGQAGAVTNQGGASVGGSDSTGQAGSATLDLSAASLTGTGSGSTAALGSVTADIGAVSAVASTPKGYGKAGSTSYKIGDLDLTLSSPLLGSLLTTLTDALNPSTVEDQLTTLLTTLNVPFPSSCNLTAESLDPLSLEGGAVTIDATSGEITVHLDQLLQQLGLDINNLPANTDLINYLLAYIADPTGLATGLNSIISSAETSLTNKFTACTTALTGTAGASAIITNGQTALTDAVTGLVGTLSESVGSNPLSPVADALQNLLDIGANVQPNGKSGTYSDPLAATPKQGTDVVDGQTIVRAIEVNVASAASGLPGLGSIPSLSSLGVAAPSTNSFVQLKSARFAAPRQAAAAGEGVLSIGLANAAAGPSTAAATPSSGVSAETTAAGTDLPTGVPAGAAGHQGGGSPALPIVLVLIGLVLAGGGVTAYRSRGKFSH